MSSFATLGSEFRVNSSTAGIQSRSSVAGLASGGFVVVWQSTSLSGNVQFGQIYDSGGAAVGGELAIAPGIAGGDARSAEVAALGTGFVVAYSAPNPPLFHPDSVWTEVFDSAGAGAGEVELENGTNTVNHNPTIASSTLGGFLTVWNENVAGSLEIRGRTSSGAVFTVNTTTAGTQYGPSVAGLQDGTGRYVVAWTENDGVGTNEMRGQLLAADGSKIGGEFTIDNDVASSSAADMEIAARPGAGWAIAYSDQFNTQVRVFGAGNAQLAAFNADDPLANEGGDESAIAVLSNGLLAVAWRHFNSGAFSMLRVFAPDGTQIGATVNLQAGGGSGIVTDPSIAALANGQFVVTWTDNRGTLGDADHGVTGQRFTTNAPNVIDGAAGADAFNGVAQTGFFMGYGGFDSVSYAGAGGAVTINLVTPALNAGAAAGDEFGNSIESIVGSGFGDTLTGNGFANNFDGGVGNDTLDGAGGDDSLSGGLGGDTLIGGAGFDTANYASAAAGVVAGLSGWTNFGEAAGDTFADVEGLSGSAFGDYLGGDGLANGLFGQNGDDTLWGYGGGDALYGQEGNDGLNGGLGGDYLDGGTGWDTARYDDAASGVVAGLSGWTNFGEAAGDTFNAVEGLYATDFADYLGGDGNANALYGRGGADVLYGYGGGDFLFGGDDGDTLLGGAAGDLLDGGAGTDAASYADAASGVTAGLSGWTNFGDAAGDTYVSIENLTGSAFGDNLGGDAQVNRIDGGAGNDALYGYGGFDTLIGGAGNDTFVWFAGSDSDFIADFQGGPGVGDVIQLQGTGFTSLAQMQAAGIVVQTPAATQTEIRLVGGTIYLWNILPGALAADDFLFV